MTGRAILVAAVLSAVAATSDCHHAPRATPDAVAPDTVRGIVSVTGTGFDQTVMLRSGTNTITLAANASDSAALTRLGGADVLVFGAREPSRFRVAAFRAMSVAGSPVVDGVLREDDGVLQLETASGRLPLGNPPVALRTQVGARVWIGGPLATGPNTFGVIVPKR
jgi:hypothetical protein